MADAERSHGPCRLVPATEERSPARYTDGSLKDPSPRHRRGQKSLLETKWLALMAERERTRIRSTGFGPAAPFLSPGETTRETRARWHARSRGPGLRARSVPRFPAPPAAPR